MNTQDEVLIRCFEAVFPGLAPDAIPHASVDTVEDWDSLQALTLAAVLEEEFAVNIDVAVLPRLRSFEDIREYLRSEGIHCDVAAG